jgi:GNAT superfamily N-acetyltransferase
LPETGLAAEAVDVASIPETNVSEERAATAASHDRIKASYLRERLGTISGMSSAVTIRGATSADEDGVFALAKAMATTFDVEPMAFATSFAALLTRDDAVVLVAVTPEQIAGYLLGFDHLTFFANGRVSYVEEVAVEDALQGAGIGRRLMEHFEEWSRKRSSVMVTVATRRASAFYGALDYEETATLFRKLM